MAGVGVAADADRAPVLANYPLRDPQTKPAALALLGSEERLKDSSHCFRRNTYAVIFYCDAHHLRRLTVSTKPRPHSNFRSEEHTSELQSHVNLVCRLLLEKKK